MRWLPRSRQIVLAMLAAYFLRSGRSAAISTGPGSAFTPESVTFGDLRSVTSGWECTRRGIDVLPANPCDPNKSPANYPRIWMSPAFLGLGQGSTEHPWSPDRGAVLPRRARGAARPRAGPGTAVLTRWRSARPPSCSASSAATSTS